jgi:ABC-type glycerol-3-phosphate transport system permease component
MKSRRRKSDREKNKSGISRSLCPSAHQGDNQPGHGRVFNRGQIMTGALLGAAPPLIIYAFLMDYYIAGLTAGATKG